MERIELEITIVDKVIEGMKAVEVLDSGRENDERLNILISLDKGASNENLKDMVGFIKFGEKNKKAAAWIAVNLMHDINGLAAFEPGFSPRTTGYDTVK
jgi:hypothetical protein